MLEPAKAGVHMRHSREDELPRLPVLEAQRHYRLCEYRWSCPHCDEVLATAERKEHVNQEHCLCSSVQDIPLTKTSGRRTAGLA